LLDTLSMLAILGSFVDFLHALLMIAWVLGLPLLFWHRHPRLTKWYAIYAVSFIVLSQGSQLLTGQCFLTAISAALWGHGSAPPGSTPDEWFTVRFARAVFHLSPSHHAISRASEVLILLTSVGLLLSMHRHRRDEQAAAGS
jgi:hypothetical protein